MRREGGGRPKGGGGDKKSWGRVRSTIGKKWEETEYSMRPPPPPPLSHSTPLSSLPIPPLPGKIFHSSLFSGSFSLSPLGSPGQEAGLKFPLFRLFFGLSLKLRNSAKNEPSRASDNLRMSSSKVYSVIAAFYVGGAAARARGEIHADEKFKGKERFHFLFPPSLFETPEARRGNPEFRSSRDVTNRPEIAVPSTPPSPLFPFWRSKKWDN